MNYDDKIRVRFDRLLTKYPIVGKFIALLICTAMAAEYIFAAAAVVTALKIMING